MPPKIDLAGSSQAISRAMLVLRVISSQGRRGMPFKTVVTATLLPQSTVHRLLKSLVNEGLVYKDVRSNKYHLAHLLYELGLLAMPQFRFTHLCQEALNRLAALTGDTVYLSERIGYESVATDCREGAYPIKALSLHVGMRRPLGIGAGGLAMLAEMPQAEALEIVKANAAYLPALGNVDQNFLLEAIKETRAQGYAYLENKATKGMGAVGVALHDPRTGGRAAISVSAVPQRLSNGRVARIAEEIRKEVAIIESRLE